MEHEQYWLDLISPFKKRFGGRVEDFYMPMRKVIHHVYAAVIGRREFDIKKLKDETGFEEQKIADIIVWLKEQDVIDFEINWTR